MGVSGPVVAPLVERILLRSLIFPFAAFAGYFVAWGVVFCIDALVKGLFGKLDSAIGWVPFANRVVQQPVAAIEHKITSYLGGMEVHFERQMATRWHGFASMMEQRNANAMRGAVIVYHTVHHLMTLWGNAATGGLMKEHAKPAKKAQAQAQAATKTATHASKEAHAATQATAGATTVTHPQTKVIVRTYPAGRLGTRVRALEGTIGRVIDWDIPGLRARDKAISDSLGRLWHRVRSERRAIGITAFVGLLVTALGRLGLSRLGCLNRKNLLQRVCRMDAGLLEALIGSTFAVLGTVSLVALAHELLDLEDVFVGAVTGFFRELRDVPRRSAAEQGF